jgi:HD-GYP domain-containing protein (c-di-GMP phosphodiesterase class II)
MAIFKETARKSSIAATLTLLFFILGVIPLLISNWKLISINREELESSLRESFVTTASNVSSQIADYIRAYRLQVQEFNPKNMSLLGSDVAGPVATPLLMKDPNILKIRLLNKSGKGPYTQKLNFQDPRVPEWEFEAFKQALQGRSYVGGPYYCGPDDVTILLIAEPVRNQEEETTAVVSVIVSLEPLVRILSDQSAGGTQVYVVDAKGNLLLHPKKTEMNAHRNLAGSAIVSDYLRTGGRLSTVRLFVETRDGKKTEILGSHSSISGLNWGVIIQIDKNIALASVNSMIKESTKWGILFALAAALAGIFFARWITNPIQVLASHALDVGRHQNFDKKIELHASNEIQQLADTFNFMTDEIKQNIENLRNAARENKDLFMSSIRMLAAVIDAKDPYTRGHSERVKDYALIIARMLGFSAIELERLEICALLHDVGKIGIEDRILRKPTNLTPEEFEIMKTHPDKGANILSQIAQLSDIIPGMRAHHENYDGTGYPQGLKGEAIPLLGRLITVADTFDAMTTDRPYQKAFTLEFALNRIRSMAGIKYDPKVVDAFSRACEEGKVSLHKPSRPRPQPMVL